MKRLLNAIVWCVLATAVVIERARQRRRKDDKS